MSNKQMPPEDTIMAFLSFTLGQQITAIKAIRGSDGFGHAVEFGGRVWYVTFSTFDGLEGTLSMRRLVGIDKITFPLPLGVDQEFQIKYNLGGAVDEDI